MNDVELQFLLNEIDYSLTMLDGAWLAEDLEVIARCRNNAQIAYQSAVHFLHTRSMSAEQRQAIEAKLSVVRERLQAPEND